MYEGPGAASLATYAAAYSPKETIIDFTEPAAVICRKVAALTVAVPWAQMSVRGCEAVIVKAELAESDGAAVPGTLLASHSDGWTVQAADGAVRLTGTRSRARNRTTSRPGCGPSVH
ncbi:hypothetical protein [Streptomyces tsukubensis]|uniref:Formyl transferase C-terminal domain-containing protein n=1 Tax=Streptomyces tsukubensis TaxID=83656 RepID=A0A1V3ZYY0_9ACTN|nr:hypothetical protein B1H18_34245 [Streptomyces tsukubensis]QFR96689.1 hypothetical protein GBW32_31220 [Streptomyces tsukubensis]